jgi:UDP-N-acetylmuramoyl-L-alanyl-D-glutamate--2,6-diaminopimelate ligase
MQLSELIDKIDAATYHMREIEVTSLEFDSRMVHPGSVFIAITGETCDGHDFINEAEKKGAVAVVTQKRVNTQLPQIIVRDSRVAMGVLAQRFYGQFSNVSKIGITGTNGKTTTAFLIHSILAAAGKNPGLIGTVYYLGKTKTKAHRTTPESLDIFKLCARFKDDGAKAIVMEVSSHALSLGRVEGIKFSSAVFTNLGQDHLDFHKSIDEYRKSKLHLFSLLEDDGSAIYNTDDPTSKAIKALNLKKTITYGVKNSGDIRGTIVEENINGLNAMISFGNEEYNIVSKLVGNFTIYNLCAAFATGVAIGIDVETIINGLEALTSVRGRMERVVDNIFVDYAHTPEAIENALNSLRHYTHGKVIIVFGCGGNRDRDKRPKMGALASRLADFTILTSDNPRSESPGDIITEIERGMQNQNYKVIEDRREAICYAISSKKPDDIVLIAGKGHEEYQIIGNTLNAFDDAKVVGECFENL